MKRARASRCIDTVGGSQFLTEQKCGRELDLVVAARFKARKWLAFADWSKVLLRQVNFAISFWLRHKN